MVPLIITNLTATIVMMSAISSKKTVGLAISMFGWNCVGCLGVWVGLVFGCLLGWFWVGMWVGFLVELVFG